jgi:DNA adenine methylase
MSTPVGAHNPVPPESFGVRVDLWHERTKGTRFVHADFAESMRTAKRGDLVYCDPPYTDSQTILYGAQAFSLERLLEEITACKSRGVAIALSIDGTKYSGRKICDVPVPEGLFEREVFMKLGRSMLKRFQMDGRTLEDHEVADRLLLTY